MLKAISRLVDFITWIFSFLLFARFIIIFIESGTRAPFTVWLYQMTEGVMTPFEGLLPAMRLSTGNIIDFSTLAAALVVGIVGYAISAFLDSTAEHIAYANTPIREPEIVVHPINSTPQNYNQPAINEPVDLKEE